MKKFLPTLLFSLIFHCSNIALLGMTDNQEIDRQENNTAQQGNFCSICREYGTLDHTLNCNHSFHAGCINTWLQTNNNCPLCRQSQTITAKVQAGAQPVTTRGQTGAQRIARMIPVKARLVIGSALCGFAGGLLTNTIWSIYKNFFGMYENEKIHIGSKLVMISLILMPNWAKHLVPIANFAIHKPIRPYIVKNWTYILSLIAGLVTFDVGFVTLDYTDHQVIRNQKLLAAGVALAGVIGGWKISPILHAATERAIKNVLGRFKVVV
ncbi:MAG: RING finger domain-containing protein [Candidatus Babeliales bacterium]